MSGSLEFISSRGAKTFEEFPFCDADAVLFCEISYAPIENAVSAGFDSPLSLPEANKILVDMRNGKDKKLGLMISNAPVRNLRRLQRFTLRSIRCNGIHPARRHSLRLLQRHGRYSCRLEGRP